MASVAVAPTDRVQTLAGSSVATFLASLSTSAALLVMSLGCFALLIRRPGWKEVYQARLYQHKGGRARPFQSNLQAWWRVVCALHEQDVFHDGGNEAGLFLRYLRLQVILFGPPALVVTPILIAVSSTSVAVHGETAGGLDRFGWVNLDPGDVKRHWAYCTTTMIYIAYVLTMILLELRRLLTWRQIWLHQADTSVQALVLVTDIPVELCSKEQIRKIYSRWNKDIEDIVLCQDQHRLRKEVDLLKQAIHRWEYTLLDHLRRNLNHSPPSKTVRARCYAQPGPGNLAIHGFGRKVDKLDHGYEGVQAAAKRVEALEATVAVAQSSSAVLFLNNSMTARAIAATPGSRQPGRYVAQFLGISTRSLLLNNLSVSWSERQLRELIVPCLSLLVIIAWSVPIGLTGFLSQLRPLIRMTTNRDLLQHWPPTVVGMLQGVLPSMALSGLMTLFPPLLRRVVEQRRLPTVEATELVFQKTYFVFLFTLVFCTVAVSSTLITILEEVLDHGSSVPIVLARGLPRAANYFQSYILIQALMFAGINVLQLRPQLSYWTRRVGRWSPRDYLASIDTVTRLQWGTTYPMYTTLACIAIIYSTMAPLILPLATLAFAVFWWVHRYLIVYVTSTEPEMNGQAFLQALQQLFVGLYFLEVSFTGLFLANISQDQRASPLLQCMCMMVMAFCTNLVHRRLRSLYFPAFHTAAVNQDSPDGVTELFRAPDSNSVIPSDVAWPRGAALRGIQMWLPRDHNGISGEMVARYGHGLIPMSDEGATLHPDGSLELT